MDDELDYCEKPKTQTVAQAKGKKDKQRKSSGLPDDAPDTITIPADDDSFGNSQGLTKVQISKNLQTSSDASALKAVR